MSNADLKLEAIGNAGRQNAAAVAALTAATAANTAALSAISGVLPVARVAVGSGVTGATVQRVVLATDVPLPAGTNAIGKIEAGTALDAKLDDIIDLLNDIVNALGTINTSLAPLVNVKPNAAVDGLKATAV